MATFNSYASEISDKNYYLGTFYQDPDSVLYGSSSTDGTTTAKADKKFASKIVGNDLWGFRFLFNPTTWSYGIQVNSSGIDWTIPNDNGSVLAFPGIGGQINITLLLDRVADMSTIRKWDQGGRKNLPGTPDYPRTLTEAECLGLLYRGTEYDLEFLFRVINGAPQDSTLLGAKDGGFEVQTSNLGYIAGVPFIFKVHDHLRYRVILNNINVRHDIFTREMVPIRTLVELTLERVPDFASDGANQSKVDKLTSLAVVLPAKQAKSITGTVKVPHGSYTGWRAE